jgi:elongation factor Ts
MAITAAQVKDLREKTGAGMMDAKRALTETDGDMEAAIDWLRTKGLAKAAKKSGRTTAEGLVAARVDGGRGVLVEINSETDFVAKNAQFQQMVAEISQAALAASDLGELKSRKIGDKTVEEVVTDKIAKIGENLALRRMVTLQGQGVVAYVHNAAADGMGKIGVLVAYDGHDETLARQVAMHVAAINPAALNEADLDPALAEREKAVLSEQARDSGKPELVIEKLIEGRMSKFYAENTLLSQPFVVNPDLAVGDAAKEGGITLTGFVRLEVGEGIAKENADFAADVAMVAGG